MHTRGVILSTGLLSLTVLAALSAPSCSSEKITDKPQPPSPLAITNPILPGDYADPSVIHVGQEYWAAATSSEWAPQFPLLKSTDLVHWEQVGNVFDTPPAWSDAHYWAPELVADKGRFFVLFTAEKKGGPLCVGLATAPQPGGPYTDIGHPLVCQEDGSIDGAMIRDENDKLYLVWKEDGNSRGLPTPIWVQPLAEDGSQLLDKPTQILVNDVPWEGQLIEGPHITQHNGWFYVFYAGSGCCGRECNYGVGVARSKSLLSGWEKNPLNPIIKSNEAFRCPGHGSVVSDDEGRDYFLYHAYRNTDTVYVGRQGMLDQIEWGADGWPTVNSRHGPGGQVLAKAPAFVDDFNSATPVLGWQWPVGFKPTFSIANGELTLAPPVERAMDPVGGVLARSTNSGNYLAEAVLDTNGLEASTSAGLSALGDPDNSVGMALHGTKVELWQRQWKDGKAVTEMPASIDAPAATGGKLYLRMTARTGHLYQFAVSTDGSTWTNVGPELNGDYLPPWDRGVRVALTVGGAATASARFDSLHITPQ